MTTKNDNLNSEELKDYDVLKAREVLKSFIYEQVYNSNYKKGLEHPSYFKEASGSEKILLQHEFYSEILNNNDFLDILQSRRSRRVFSNEKITLEELSFLLWSTQGILKASKKLTSSLRTVPSGGANHPLETYIIVNNVEGLDMGLYHYLPLENSIEKIKDIENYSDVIQEGIQQSWVANASATIVWTACPERTEYKYSIDAYKLILMDAGHVGQNMYLAAESLGLGTTLIDSYNQKKLDEFLGVDGLNEISIYVAAVGTLKK